MATVDMRAIGLVAGPIGAALLWAVGPPAGFSAPAWLTAALTLLMAIWWMTEALPLPVTALLPLPLLPGLGIADAEAAAAPYASPIVFLFLGGFLLAAGVQRWQLHYRVAIELMARVGTRPDAIIGGVMGVSAFLSMWISNTATAAMMLPIALSVTALAAGDPALAGAGRDRRLTAATLLGIAFGANIGGIATLIGTPPNAVLAGFLADQHGIRIGFGEWMMLGVPTALVLLVLAWWILARWVFALDVGALPGVAREIAQERAEFAPLSSAQRRMLAVAAIAVLAWLTRPLLESLGLALSDPAIAITAGIALFIVPSTGWRGPPLLRWDDSSEVSWGVLILVGGGLSLGNAIAVSGLADAIAATLGGIGDLPLALILLVVAALTMALSHVTTNTGTAATLMPVATGLATTLGEAPLTFAIVVALAASCAFMLPVATPPNAIVFASHRLRVADMMRAGAPLNAVALGIVIGVALALVPWLVQGG